MAMDKRREFDKAAKAARKISQKDPKAFEKMGNHCSTVLRGSMDVLIEVYEAEGWHPYSIGSAVVCASLGEQVRLLAQLGVKNPRGAIIEYLDMMLKANPGLAMPPLTADSETEGRG